MSYAEFAASEGYVSKQSGAAIGIKIFRRDLGAIPLIAQAAGINHNDNFSVNPVEEAGNHKVDEHVPGRHTGSLTINGLWTAEWNDRLPDADSFLAEGQEYTVMEVIAPLRTGAGQPVNVYTNAILSSYSSRHGARGLKSFDLAFSYTKRTPGGTWAAENGG